MSGARSTRSDRPSVGLIRPALGRSCVRLLPESDDDDRFPKARLLNGFAARSSESRSLAMSTFLPSKHPGQRPSTTS